MKYIAHKVLDLAGARAEVPPSTEVESRRVITPESIRGAISSDSGLALMVAELQRRNEEEDEGEDSDDIEQPVTDFVTQPSTVSAVQCLTGSASSAPSNSSSPAAAPIWVSSRSEGETLIATVLDLSLNPLPAIVWNRLTQNYSNPGT